MLQSNRLTKTYGRLLAFLIIFAYHVAEAKACHGPTDHEDQGFDCRHAQGPPFPDFRIGFGFLCNQRADPSGEDLPPLPFDSALPNYSKHMFENQGLIYLYYKRFKMRKALYEGVRDFCYGRCKERR